MALTGRAPLLALLGVLPVALTADRLALLAWLLVLVLVALVDVVLAAPVPGLRLTRSGATTCRLGTTVEVQLSLVNTSSRRLRGLVRDAWVPSAGALPRTHQVVVPRGERRVLTTTLTPTRRGDRRPDRVTVRSIGPLGVAGRQGRHELPWRLRVQPPFTSRTFLPQKLDRLRQLDTGRTSAGRIGDVPRLDAALDAALLLGALASKAGDHVDLLAVDRELRASVKGAGREQLLAQLVDAMALLEPALVETDGRRIATEVLRRTGRHSLVVIFTSLDASPLRHGLLPVLSSLTRRHAVLLASVGDPRVAALAEERGDVDAVYAAAAAERAGSERRQMSAVLRQRGVEVVDAAPAGFASAVADAYLGMKAAGRL